MRSAPALFLAAGLLALASATVRADPAAGEKVFGDQGCSECHYTDGPAKENTIADQLAKRGPELWYAGSKFQQPWLEGWLQNPEPIRSMAYNSITERNPGNHPKLSGGDAASVTEFLMSLTSKDVEAGAIKPKKNLKGKLIFTKNMPCTGCHQYPGRKDEVLGGLSGPSLVSAGNRLNPDWIFAYLKTPDIFKPVKAMPTFAGILSDKDMQDVATYVSTLK
jgi:mono/diheme cytochrome c family protein